MSRRTQWRDRKEWRSTGLPFSTTSDEACKLYDAALTQYAGYYDEPSLGGTTQTLRDLVAADPENIMGHCVDLGLEMLVRGQCVSVDGDLRKRVDMLKDLANCDSISDWEKRHAKAIELMSDGHLRGARDTWADINLDYPLDFLALRLSFDMSITLGTMPERRDTLAGVVRHWTADMPNYGYLLGMYAFALSETSNHQRAEVMARQALDINPLDTWTNHTLLHVLDAGCRYQEATDQLRTTEDSWSKGEHLACHTYWHWALCDIEKGDYEAALAIYDSELATRTVKTKGQFNFTDCSSLLFRLEMEGVNVKDRWEDAYEVCRPMMDDNQFPYADPHITMACLGSKHRDEVCNLIDTIDKSASVGETDGHKVKKSVGADLCRSLVAYSEGDYGAAVDLFQSIRYKLYTIGSSNAQRDVFAQFFMHAAMKSPNAHHKNLARSLMFERQEKYGNPSPLTDRLISQLMDTHQQ